MFRSSITVLVATCSLTVAAQGQGLCVRLGTSWLIGNARLQQLSGSGQKIQGLVSDRQYVDRRTLRRTSGGYRLDIRRTKLGLRDETVDIAVDYGSTGSPISVTGDTATFGRDLVPLLPVACRDLTPGAAIPDRGGRVDSLHTATQRNVARIVAANSLTVGVPIDTLGQRLLPVFVRRALSDSTRALLLRQQPNQTPDTVRAWSVTAGEERERQLVRTSDGAVIYREQARQLDGRGWAPPHDMNDTVPIRVQSVIVERMVDSSVAAGVLTFVRRGDQSVSSIGGDTAAMHYREWRGDTLVLRIFRRNGWRNELRSIWRGDTVLLSAALHEPGSAAQQPGPFTRTFRVQRGFLSDAGSRDSAVAVPGLPWGIALDGFEEMLVPALRALPTDEKPHPIALYAVVDGRGSWLAWSASVAARGNVRVAKLYTLQKKWAGSFIFTPTGELLLASLAGGGGVLRMPVPGTRVANLLQAAQAVVKREDLVPVAPAPAAGKP